jgi:selenide,water dikinase
VHFDPSLDEPSQLLLFDSQTSGGLLLAVPPDKLEKFLTRAEQLEQPLCVVGEVVPGKGIEVTQ